MPDTNLESKKVKILAKAGVEIDGKKYANGAIVPTTEKDTLYCWATNKDTNGVPEQICKFADKKDLKDYEEVNQDDAVKTLHKKLLAMERPELFAEANYLGIKFVPTITNSQLVCKICIAQSVEVPEILKDIAAGKSKGSKKKKDTDDE